MVKSCMAPGCHNKQSNSNNQVHFHRLPLHNPLLLKQWLAAMKFQNPPVNKYSRIYSDHFAPENYVSNIRGQLLGIKLKSQLKKNAVPSIFHFSQYQKINDVPNSSKSFQKNNNRKKRWQEINKKREIEIGMFIHYCFLIS